MIIMRRTKIIATLGPATDDPKILAGVINAGADVVRINFSHGSPAEHKRRVEMVRKISAESGKYIGILGDLQGSKIRIKGFRKSPVVLKEGQKFVLDCSMAADAGTNKAVGVAYEKLFTDVSLGDRLLLDDGQLILEVEKIDGERIICRVVMGGKLADNKGINRQGGGLSVPTLATKDRENIVRTAEYGLDWLAVSFVRHASDIDEVRKILCTLGSEAHLVAKIERAEALENLEAIIDTADAVMVARGDLGVEVGYASLTGLQKRIIKLARTQHKVVITATQMMESMVNSQLPTRAEISDVANAVMDGTDAVMLSAETAAGNYPVQAVTAMAEVCSGAERYPLVSGRTSRRLEDRFQFVDEAIAMAVMYTANHMDVDAIIALTESGSTVLWMSRVRSDIPIYAITRHEITLRRMTLYRGVYPIYFDVVYADAQKMYGDILGKLREQNFIEKENLVIVTKGELLGISGGTNSMKILRVSD
jgi:pyruvate kinase